LSLRNSSAASSVNEVAHRLLRTLEISERDLAPAFLSEGGESLLGVFAPSAVFAVGEVVRDHGIGNEKREVVGMERDEFRFLGLTIDENEVVLLTEGGGELIHDATGDVDEIVFGLLAEEGLFLGVEDGVDQAFHDGCEGEFEGGGRGEPSADGKAGDDDGVEAGHRPAALQAEPFEHPPQIIHPFGISGLLRAFEGDDGLLFAGGPNPRLVGTVQGGGDDDVTIDGEREHKAIAVIDVFTDEVDPSRGRRDESGLLVVEVLQIDPRVDGEIGEWFVGLKWHEVAPRGGAQVLARAREGGKTNENCLCP
jgi:hypothetical protein